MVSRDVLLKVFQLYENFIDTISIKGKNTVISKL